MNQSELPVLLIEDNSDDVILIRRAFDKANLKHPLVVISDGEAAEAFLLGKGPHADRGFPALIILDLKMPGRSGLEILAWLRSQKNLGYVPVVVLSGTEDPKQVNRAYELGANSYVSKNQIETDVLAERVKGLLKYWLESNFLPQAPKAVVGG